MSARAPFKNLCPRERTRLPMLKESASLSCPCGAALVLTQCFRRGQLSARCLRAPRLHISAAPSLDNPAASPNGRPFCGSGRVLSSRRGPTGRILSFLAAGLKLSFGSALPRGSPFPAAIPSLGPDFSLPRLSHASPWFRPPSAPCASSFFPRPIFPRPCLARS